MVDRIKKLIQEMEAEEKEIIQQEGTIEAELSNQNSEQGAAQEDEGNAALPAISGSGNNSIVFFIVFLVLILLFLGEL